MTVGVAVPMEMIILAVNQQQFKQTKKKSLNAFKRNIKENASKNISHKHGNEQEKKTQAKK